MESEVANVMGTITYRQEFDLSALADTFSARTEITNVTYEPADNHWLQTRFAPDNSYVAFYRSGRCSITGTQSLEHFQQVVDRVNDVMHDLLDFDYNPKVEVNNIVVTADLGLNVPLEVLSLELGLNTVEYEPEQFPALIYRGPSYIILVFSSGKLVCTGLTDLDKISDAVEYMASQIQILT